MPIDSDSASSVNVFIEKPAKYITANVPKTETGIASTTLNVEDSEPRNSQHTNAVSSTDNSSVSLISSTASLMKRLLSTRTSNDNPSGSVLRNSLSRARTESATSTVLDPCCLMIPSPCAGKPFARPMRRRSSKPSSTSATSFK